MNARVLPLLALFALLLGSARAPAQVPTLINYQGRLLDGTNLVNRTVGLTLRLYDEATGGNLLYADSNTVAVVDGLYATFLGDNTVEGSLDDAAFSTNLHLEVVVDGQVLVPRERIAAATYALLAGNVPDGAITPSKLAPGSIGAEQIAPGSITAEQLAPGTIDTDAIGSYQVGPENLRLAGGTTGGFLARTNAPNPAPAAGDRFGWSLLLTKSLYTRLWVGAPFADVGAADAGAAWRFTDDGSGFSFSTNGAALNPPLLVTNPVLSVGAQFGYAMAPMGGSAGHVIAAPGAEAGLTKTSGVVHLYSTFGTYVGQVVNPSPAAGDRFGHAVAAGPDSGFLAGAPFDDAAGSDAGIAYFFDNSGSVITVFTNLLPGANDQFGSALLAVDTNQFLVAAPGADAGATDAGRVSLFTRQGIIVGFFASPSPRVGGRFGSSMALVGNGLIAIGEPGTGSNGLVHVYQSNGTLAYSLDAGFYEGETNAFGQAIAPVGPGMLAVGLPKKDFLDPDQGAAIFFNTAGEEIAFTVPTSQTGGAQAGTALLALDSRTLVVGAPFADGNGSIDAGGLTIISLDTYMPGLIAEGVRNEAIGLDQLNTDSVDQHYVKKSGDIMTGFLTLGDATVTGHLSVAPFPISSSAEIHVRRASSGLTPNPSALLALENNESTFVHFLTPTGTTSGILFGHPTNTLDASIRYNHNGGRELLFRTGDNNTRMVILTNGFVGIGTSAPTNRLHVVGTVQATAYITASDRNLKENVQPVSPEDILRKVEALPIATWTFIEESSGTHLGPMAQDFHAAFGLGNTDSGIATVDADGVALAAIQALAAENRQLREELDDIKQRLGWPLQNP